MGRKMRRFRQELAMEECHRILYCGKYAVWAMTSDDDYAYVVPVNYAYDGTAIYVHCAKQGHKLDCIMRNPGCSMCVVDKDDVIPEEFTSYFRSVIVFGKAALVNDDKEVIKGLSLLCEKYSPGIDPSDEIARFIKAVCVVRIDIDLITGKQAKELISVRK